MQPSLFKSVRADLAARIARGDLRPGDRLPSERDLTEQFGVTRSVIRQAIAGLVRDGMVISAYPRGYVVLGRRIPWLPRLRPLVDEPWEIEIIDTTERPAGPDDADTFGLIEGDPLARCLFQLRGTHTHTPWALALATYPLDAFNTATRDLLRRAGFIDDHQLEQTSRRRILGHHETITARLPTTTERDQLDITATQPILALTRTARTTTTPITQLTVAARPDRLQLDQLIDA
jgi:GntR family transcriptional regulator